MKPSYFPRWTLRDGAVVAPDERLPAVQTMALGVQHVVAMFGATVLAPLLMGFDPNVAIFFSGIGTLVFFVAVGGRVPSYLGSSFSFIAVVIAATAYAGSGPNANSAAALGGIVACGALYAVIGLVVMKAGYAWIETLMPPVVTGAIVAVIGLNLAPIAVKGIAGKRQIGQLERHGLGPRSLGFRCVNEMGTPRLLFQSHKSLRTTLSRS